MRVLVTGGSGFVGRHVLRRLALDHDVINVGRHVPEPSPEQVRDVDLDLGELTPEGLDRAVGGRLDAVVHLAARMDNPLGTDYTLAELASSSVAGTLRLLEAAAALGVRRFVLGSIGGVGLNPPPGVPMREDDPPGPVNPYGLTSHSAEQALPADAWPFERISLRYFAPYGRDGSNPMFRHVLECLRSGEPIDVGLGGGPELNPVHIDDAVAATVAAIHAADLPSVINVGGPEVGSLAKIARLMGLAIGRPAVLREGGAAALNWVADVTRMRTHLVAPSIGLVAGITREWGRAG